MGGDLFSRILGGLFNGKGGEKIKITGTGFEQKYGPSYNLKGGTGGMPTKILKPKQREVTENGGDPLV